MAPLQITHDRLIKAASYASVITAAIIMLVKSYGWLSTSSQSILASLIDSLLDISSALVNLVAIRIALLPPDDNHRFGHEKFQDLAIFSQSIFFFASCCFTLFCSGKALYFQDKPQNVETGSGAMYICILITFTFVLFQTYVVKKTNSKIIEVDKLHYFADLLTNIAVVVSLHFSKKFWYIDSMIGIAISIYIMSGSFFLFKGAIKNLVDEEFSDDQRKKIIMVIESFPETRGWHELKTRLAGNKPFIQFHLELDEMLSLKNSHDISDKICDKLIEFFPNAEIIIHTDPV